MVAVAMPKTVRLCAKRPDSMMGKRVITRGRLVSGSCLSSSRYSMMNFSRCQTK